MSPNAFNPAAPVLYTRLHLFGCCNERSPLQPITGLCIIWHKTDPLIIDVGILACHWCNHVNRTWWRGLEQQHLKQWGIKLFTCLKTITCGDHIFFFFNNLENPFNISTIGKCSCQRWTCTNLYRLKSNDP